MSRDVRIARPARNDIDEVLSFTEREFGEMQHDRYDRLIRDAVREVAIDPDGPRVRRRPDVHADARVIHIARRGRHARHLVLFRVLRDGSIGVARVLHDSMDLRRHVPADFGDDGAYSDAD